MDNDHEYTLPTSDQPHSTQVSVTTNSHSVISRFVHDTTTNCTCDSLAIFRLGDAVYKGVAPVHEGDLFAFLQQLHILLIKPYLLHTMNTTILPTAVVIVAIIMLLLMLMIETTPFQCLQCHEAPMDTPLCVYSTCKDRETGLRLLDVKFGAPIPKSSQRGAVLRQQPVRSIRMC